MVREITLKDLWYFGIIVVILLISLAIFDWVQRHWLLVIIIGIIVYLIYIYFKVKKGGE